MKTLDATFRVTLSQEQLDAIFKEQLEKLTRGFWVIEPGDDTRDNDSPGIYEERYGSHRYDHKVAELDNPHFKIIVAAYRLARVLREQAELERKQKCTCIHGHFCPVHPKRRFCEPQDPDHRA